ncbi:pirin family protein [Micromonospora sp. NPDC005171]|uniref:pirin family protein n=1 Tax=Micromonospora sp. NPDC005171 TaxID=3156866 RepID=UPI0033B4BD3D
MSESTHRTARRVDRVHDRIEIGANEQSDNRMIIIPPGRPALTDPFLVMGEEQFSRPGFDWHPHRGMETITIVLDGLLEHGDNKGNAGVLEPGDVQWMTAGHGIIHREVAVRHEYAHIIQLWLNLPADRKLSPSRYQDLRASGHAAHSLPGAFVQVISGHDGSVTGPARNHWPVLGMLLTLDPQADHQQLLPADHRAFAYVISGRATIGSRMVRAGQIAWSDPVGEPNEPTTLRLSAADSDRHTKIMLFAGRPIGQPVAASGPFVMNSHAEIEKAYRDLRAGAFGTIPRLTSGK